MLVAALAAMIPATASARSSVSAAGPRLGFSVDPDQVVLGGQFVIGEVAPKVSFDPNLELGFGDHRTVIGLGFDFHYHLSLSDSDWRPYLGAGVGVHFTDRDRPYPYTDDTDTQAGGNFIVGTRVPTRSGNMFFTELKLGIGDIPSLKVLAGWNFRI